MVPPLPFKDETRQCNQSDYVLGVLDLPTAIGVGIIAREGAIPLPATHMLDHSITGQTNVLQLLSNRVLAPVVMKKGTPCNSVKLDLTLYTRLEDLCLIRTLRGTCGVLRCACWRAMDCFS